MELTFEKVDQYFTSGAGYVSEFELTADANLHIERPSGGRFLLYQRGVGSEYDIVDGLFDQDHKDVIDVDLSALVYPKYLKVISEVEPSYAEVVSDGEVTEIKSQSKEVEIVSNGTTDVTPDAGYSYLSGVSVKVNVPQEGGDTPSGGSTWRYFDLSESSVPAESRVENFCTFTHNAVVCAWGDLWSIMPLGAAIEQYGYPMSNCELMRIAVCEDMYYYLCDGGIPPARMGDVLSQVLPIFFEMGVKEITEEEFNDIPLVAHSYGSSR